MKIYYFDIKVLRDRKLFDQMLKTIDSKKKEEVNKQKITADKLRMLAGGLLINFVRKEYGIDNEIVVDKYGKPEFKKSKVKFNLSHSGKFAIIAVSDRNIGIDIQKIKEDKHRVAERNFTPAECDYINKARTDEARCQRFSEIWTMKEAYLKNIGLGLRKPLNSFEIDMKDGKARVKGLKEYNFIQFKMDQMYMVSICSDRRDTEYEVKEVTI